MAPLGSSAAVIGSSVRGRTGLRRVWTARPAPGSRSSGGCCRRTACVPIRRNDTAWPAAGSPLSRRRGGRGPRRFRRAGAVAHRAPQERSRRVRDSPAPPWSRRYPGGHRSGRAPGRSRRQRPDRRRSGRSTGRRRRSNASGWLSRHSPTRMHRIEVDRDLDRRAAVEDLAHAVLLGDERLEGVHVLVLRGVVEELRVAFLERGDVGAVRGGGFQLRGLAHGLTGLRRIDRGACTPCRSARG